MAPKSEEIAAQLLEIQAANEGVLTARNIVEAAAAEEHPLHPHFEWDDAVAGPKYRLQQARALVRVVKLEFVGARGHPEEIRVFHSVQSANSPTGRAYVHLDDIKANEVLTQQPKRQMEMEWRALKRKYDHFDDFIRMVQRDMARHPEEGGADEPLALDG
jgi:hypothetical protein